MDLARALHQATAEERQSPLVCALMGELGIVRRELAAVIRSRDRERATILRLEGSVDQLIARHGGIKKGPPLG